MVSWLASALAGSAFGRAFGGALALLVALALFLARRDHTTALRVRERNEVNRLRDQVRIMQRMEHADIGHGDDADDVEWLRRRANTRREPPVVRRNGG